MIRILLFTRGEDQCFKCYSRTGKAIIGSIILKETKEKLYDSIPTLIHLLLISCQIHLLHYYIFLAVGS